MSTAIALERDALQRAEKLYFARKYETAAVLLRKIVEAEPENGRANSLLGDIYYLQGNYEAAVSHLLRATELNHKPAEDFFRLGQCYQKLQKPHQAIKAYETAYQKNPQLASALFQAGYVALVLERDKKKTIDFWQRFADAAPTDPQREKVLAAIKILSDPNFVLPDRNSPISLEEALLLGGGGAAEIKPGEDKAAGYEKEKEKNDGKELLDDDRIN
ncbi:MAG: tetratricopeptide repeat protein [Leptospiraceae bacterium]|nr:tetratricopeptide repeat protein [Leptospiraceae bacterium]